MDTLQTYVREIATAARSAAMELAGTIGQKRDAALQAAATALRDRQDKLQEANQKDLARAGEFHLTDAMIDRLRLDEKRINSMAGSLEQIAAQVDPVGRTVTAYNRPNGLRIEKRRVPIGVVGIVYESRPNVTADAAGLCLKSANACILRGGKEALHSNLAIASALAEGIASAGLPEAAVTMIDRTEHEIVDHLAAAEGLVDVIIPRGGEKLIRAVVEAARVPVIKHYTGNCHVYVHARADLEMAERIALNAKCQRPGVCNAMETLLVDEAVAERFLPSVGEKLLAEGVEIRGCQRTRELIEQARPVSEDDYRTEYLSLILAVRVVDSLRAAIEHINTYGSKHTDAIVTESVAAARAFVAGADSASVMINCSTRLSDGGVYGLGAEVGISTDKLHARGPMGAEDLTSTKWIVSGDGHLRE